MARRRRARFRTTETSARPLPSERPRARHMLHCKYYPELSHDARLFYDAIIAGEDGVGPSGLAQPVDGAVDLVEERRTG